MDSTLERRQYPVGRFVLPATLSPSEIREGIDYLTTYPTHLSGLVSHLSDDALKATYRPGGWNIRQVVHHVNDSHMHAFIRFKLALTEDKPVIKPYEESLWAEQIDYTLSPNESLILLKHIHHRWVTLMNAMSDDDWHKRFVHPQYNREQSLAQTLALYYWHGRHHLAHVEVAIGIRRIDQ